MCIEYFSKKDPNGKLSIEKHVANKSPKEYSELIIYCSKFYIIQKNKLRNII